ncbi:CHAT domain-containing protein [Anabaena cylindrica FACHB-243]|uniref:Tetratricopeptide TPR_2 repeat-containing protein n=1 Tax=Anabaena cylindrica (strain ATCC 27899 / PCC 7122) TaxID=272123 RepID=K9ZNC2_ANACC|nr:MULTISPECIES: CHAT domain-containing protein [Anabaena]AFZ59825.1 Tetratricopeptide TPR_2 repeat-containing protein [Anabaena cylindrica PCC 7122]MBD2417224.1 CHAT domain-containing protein [Anabaena cylindrica FACHB-243]MBY5282308.1 CHAT domain-containing protein [Anabaena sp. CCAP 1446/1C]MBY5309766.1 CHAT domain-containing protein [Anabaena sp. CCAP 1446/1C]MCM2404960.1 CHAT domain-containing protein [Anabaena sp. CCAP 1446/1C]
MRIHSANLGFITLLLSISSISVLTPIGNFAPVFAQEVSNQTQKDQADRLLRETIYLMTNAHIYRRSYDRIINSFEKTLEAYQNIGDKPGITKTLDYLAFVYYSRKNYQQALNYYQQVLKLQQELGDSKGEKQTLMKIMNLENEQSRELYEQGQYQKALEKLQKVLKLREQLDLQDLKGQLDLQDVKIQTGFIINKIGMIHHTLGEYETALKFYQQSLSVFREVTTQPVEKIPWVWTVFFNMGEIYQSLGENERALNSYQQALKLAQENKIGSEVKNINAIGNSYYRLKRYDLALNFYQQSLAKLPGVKNKKEKKLLEALTFNNIGLVHLDQGNYDLSLKFLQQGLNIVKSLRDKLSQGVLLDSIGKVYFQQGKYELAGNFYQQSLTLFQEIGYKAGEAKVLSSLGYLLEKQKQPQLAIVFFKQSVNAREGIRNNIKGLSQEQRQSYTETIAEDYRHLADLLLRENRILEAQRVLDLLKVQELADYLSNVRSSNNTVQGITKRPQEQQIIQGMSAQIDKAISQGQELALLENIGVNQRTEKQKQRIIELRKSEQQITKEFATFLESPQVRQWIAELQKTTQGQAIDLNAYATTLQDNLKKINQDAVIIYPFVLEDRLELVLISPYAPPLKRTVPVKREELNRAIAEFRSTVTTPIRNPKIPAQKLYNWLIKPLENDLVQAKTKTIIYAPDRQLRYIPLAALHDGKQWLIERFRINNITAVSLTDLNTKPQNRLNVLAAAFTKGNYSVKAGDQEFNFSGLPFAGREVETLAQTIPNTTKLLDQQFTKDIVLQMNDYSIVHLATHAVFTLGQPEESFILFGNGDRITLRDIKNWRLPNVDLVVLSACATGLGDRLGDGREILGFGYQMQQTGARAAIASLWSVDDGGTQALMNTFYTVLQQGNITKAEALRQAQISLITGNYTITGQERRISIKQPINSNLPSQVSDRLSHPFYWSPFILVGNGL